MRNKVNAKEEFFKREIRDGKKKRGLKHVICDTTLLPEGKLPL